MLGGLEGQLLSFGQARKRLVQGHQGDFQCLAAERFAFRRFAHRQVEQSEIVQAAGRERMLCTERSLPNGESLPEERLGLDRVAVRLFERPS